MTGVERQLTQLQTTLGPDEAAPGDDTTPHLDTGTLVPARRSR
ncbi:hypothetical protein ACIOGZ_41775 [Kitasatospora sp. NPDC088160]